MCVRGHKKQVDPNEKIFFCCRKHIGNAKQGQKLALDLVESIMRPTDPTNEELRRILIKMNQFAPKILEIRVSTF